VRWSSINSYTLPLPFISGVARGRRPLWAAVRRGQQNGRDNGKMVVKTAKMGLIRGHQASDDRWGRQNCSPPWVAITHVMPLSGISTTSVKGGCWIVQ